MKKFLHQKFGWFNHHTNFWLKTKSVERVIKNNQGGAYVNLTLKCSICGKEETAFQTRSQGDIPEVGSIDIPAYMTR